MDCLSKEQRHKNMQAIHSKDTKIEIALRKALWDKGYRYRKNCKNVFGKPDIVFRKYKLAIFCDSEFWHGKNWKKEKNRIGTNKKFWYKKIESNIKRDKLVNKTLKKSQWIVLRFWGEEINNNLNKCLSLVERYFKTL